MTRSASLDRRLVMVSVQDIGRVIADLLMDTQMAPGVVELEGPERYSATDRAAVFSKVFERNVSFGAIPHEDWEAVFRADGMRQPLARIIMLEGFGQGWLDFETPVADHHFGATSLETVVRDLVERAYSRSSCRSA